MDKKSLSVFHSIPWLLGWVSLSLMGPYMMLKLIFKSLQVVISNIFESESQFQGKVVFLTGASSGLGLALAHSLYKRGCKLILASRNVKALEELKQNLIQEYNPPELHIPLIVHLDLEELNSIPDVVEKALKSCGGHIDILINNAGVSYRGEIASTDISVDLKVMLVNYFGQVALTKAILPTMIARNSGLIVGISSLQGKIAIPYRSCYGASKHALQAFLDSLRLEVAKHNIQVTVISPGYIETNLSKNAIFGSEDAAKYETKVQAMSPESVAETISNSLISKPKELLVCSFSYRLITYLRNLCPSLYFYVLSVRTKWMAAGIKTGQNTKRKKC